MPERTIRSVNNGTEDLERKSWSGQVEIDKLEQKKQERTIRSGQVEYAHLLLNSYRGKSDSACVMNGDDEK